MTEHPTESVSLSDGEFIRLLTVSQRPLFLHILPLVGNATDADEVLQETSVILWSKRQEFEPGTNFLAWGRAIARLEVFRFRRRNPAKLKFLTDEMIVAIADRANGDNSVSGDSRLEIDRRQEALTTCLEQLRESDRQLIQLRYTPGHTGDDVARLLGRPANSVYQSIGRIRRVLMECVQRKLTAGGVS